MQEEARELLVELESRDIVVKSRAQDENFKELGNIDADLVGMARSREELAEHI